MTQAVDVVGMIEEALAAVVVAKDLYDKFHAGEMTEEQALAAWRDNAAEVRKQGARFDELMGRDPV